MVADYDISGIQQGTVHVDQAVVSYTDIAAVIHKNGLIDTGMLSALSQQQAQNLLVKPRVLRRQAVIKAHQILCPAAHAAQFRVTRILPSAARHLF